MTNEKVGLIPAVTALTKAIESLEVTIIYKKGEPTWEDIIDFATNYDAWEKQLEAELKVLDKKQSELGEETSICYGKLLAVRRRKREMAKV